MQLFYTPDLSGNRYTLSEEESKHCIRVLRLGVGDLIHITDGRGNMHEARIISDSPKRCEVEIVQTTQNYGKRDYYIEMGVAPTKNNDRFEWFLEKATEIGIDKVVPIECDHSERRVLKIDRCAKVITGAVKQSLKAYHPEIEELTSVDSLIKQKFDGKKFIAHCMGDSPRVLLKDAVSSGDRVLILIGPEGDFSPREAELARANGFVEISLGESRLRTETAAVAACHTVALANQ